MSTGRCGRLWEVEAARDGRLSDPALAAHALHVAACRECGHEQRGLDAIAYNLHESAVVVDEVSLRRLRQVMLQRAFERSRTPERSRWVVSVAAATLIAGAIAFVAFSRHPANEAPSVVVTANAGATWTRRSAQEVEYVDLGDGVFNLVVRRGPSDRRVIVRVPDGEIEDFGTAFDVHVKGVRTVRIAVREGAVAFRRRGETSLRLSAGMAWAVDQPAAIVGVVAAVHSPRAATPLPAASPSVAPLAPSSPQARAPRAALVAAKARVAKLPATTAASEAPDMAEDAAYLHVLALLREARGEEARLAAVAYLRQFPNGFRRVEVQRLAHPAPASSKRSAP